MHWTFDSDRTSFQDEPITWRNTRRRHAQPNKTGAQDHSSRKWLATKLQHRIEGAITVTSVVADHLQLEIWRVCKTIF